MKTDTNENFGWRLLSRNNFKEISCISVSVHKKDLLICLSNTTNFLKTGGSLWLKFAN